MAEVPAKIIPRALRKSYTTPHFTPYPLLDSSKSHFYGGTLHQMTKGFYSKAPHMHNHPMDRAEDKICQDLFESRYWAHVNLRAQAVEAAIRKFDPEMKNVPTATMTALSEAKTTVQPTYPDDLQSAVADKAAGFTYMNRENHFNKLYEVMNCNSASGRLNIMWTWFLLAIWVFFNAKFQPIAKVKYGIAQVKSIF